MIVGEEQKFVHQFVDIITVAVNYSPLFLIFRKIGSYKAVNPCFYRICIFLEGNMYVTAVMSGVTALYRVQTQRYIMTHSVLLH